ncbi:hypothetical protein [Rhodoferax sp.]|uniref:hypothetical protein n=1 Tax=Rhodoferax sp. TaxID=50421 RepID=UPI00374D7035
MDLSERKLNKIQIVGEPVNFTGLEDPGELMRLMFVGRFALARQYQVPGKRISGIGLSVNCRS